MRDLRTPRPERAQPTRGTSLSSTEESLELVEETFDGRSELFGHLIRQGNHSTGDLFERRIRQCLTHPLERGIGIGIIAGADQHDRATQPLESGGDVETRDNTMSLRRERSRFQSV